MVRNFIGVSAALFDSRQRRFADLPRRFSKGPAGHPHAAIGCAAWSVKNDFVTLPLPAPPESVRLAQDDRGSAAEVRKNRFPAFIRTPACRRLLAFSNLNDSNY